MDNATFARRYQLLRERATLLRLARYAVTDAQRGMVYGRLGRNSAEFAKTGLIWQF